MSASSVSANPNPKKLYPASKVFSLAECVRARLLEGDPRVGSNARCEIAGSLRRGRPEVGDVEIVIEPTFDEDLFGNRMTASANLHAAIERCVRDGLLSWDRQVVRNGPRHKRLLFQPLGIALDLFVASPDNWGNILAIRTGDAEFSRLLVTQRYKGGLLPDWMRHGDGRLYARAKGYPDFKQAPEPNAYTENVVACPTEEAFFACLGLHVPPMEFRTAGSQRLLLQRESKSRHSVIQQSVGQQSVGQQSVLRQSVDRHSIDLHSKAGSRLVGGPV